MTLDSLAALALFAFVSSITPGPNNLMLLASGANFGFVRSIPHMLGISLGFIVMVVLVGLGLSRVFTAFPVSYDVLRVLGVAYLIYLAWKIATASPPESDGAQGAPFSFLQAALFQWVNPKAWAMALTAVSVYAPSHTMGAVVLVSCVFGCINLPCVSCWTFLGQKIQLLLKGDRSLRAFNVGMACLLLLTLWFVF